MATIEKRGNAYRIRVSGGYTADGKQVRHSFTWTPPEGMSEKKARKEAEQEAARLEAMVTGGSFMDGRIKFEEFSQIYLRDSKLKAKTKQNYTSWARPHSHTARASARCPTCTGSKLPPNITVRFLIIKKFINNFNQLSLCGLKVIVDNHPVGKLRERHLILGLADAFLNLFGRSVTTTHKTLAQSGY